ncbi:phosphocarrier protein [Streptomyces sp. LamerLS-316]|uniref:HPr family phosphocarrier protein n=1 Tax=unclassified Streptomyces TaxID=2593676 RepID=UPI0008239CD6|nr:HPr family phosphocarrier protein [Streptomyces sp. LamerLS-316]MYQ40822.1 HPr family phosphocarrier protein [Streptomyces sp. SID4921]SCK05712.1 phosphocarrier protein [Streptomyces sp. LamerLS-316]
MYQRTVPVGSRSGLHARPASLFVQAAARQPVTVTVAREGGTPVDARSMLSVLALAAQHGDLLVLSAVGESAEGAVDELASLLSKDLDQKDPAQ